MAQLECELKLDSKLIKEATKALTELEAAAKKAESALNRLGFKLLESNEKR